MSNLSFITLLSYDYGYAFDSIKAYYHLADEIILGLDKDYISWSRNPFDFDEKALEEYISKIDENKKIKIVRGNFHDLERPIDNDTAERRFLSSQCKTGNWILQIDADEFMLNPTEFKEFMDDVPEGFAIKGNWITVFKGFFDQGKILVIDANGDTDGKIFIGTQLQNAYTMCRDTDEMALQSPVKLLHFSWGRDRSQLKQKLENWGHSKDFDTNAWLQMWDQVTLENYQNFKNLHPLHGPHWPKLKLLDFKELMSSQGEQNAI